MSTAPITLEEFHLLLTTAAGEDESIDLTGDIADTDFADLGYDSLALLETAGLIARKYGVKLSDEDVDRIATPRQFLETLNNALAS